MEQDLPADGQRPNERRFKSPLDGPNIPFGAEVKFYFASATDQGRVHQYKSLSCDIHWIRLDRGRMLDR